MLSREQTNCARGIATMIIVLFHLFIAWEWPRIVNLPSSVGVAMFLFLSGFGINESYKKNGLNKYWRKKFCRIILPFWLFVTVIIPFKNEFSLQSYLLEILFIDSDFWFIPYLVWCYSIYWILQRFYSSHFILLYTIIAFLGLNLLYQMAAEQSFSFFIGVLVSRNIEKINRLSIKNILLICLILFFFSISFLLLKEIPAVHAYKGTILYNYILLMIKLPLGICLICLPIILPYLLRSKLLYLCGIASLEIYLVHMFVVLRVEMNLFQIMLFFIYVIVASTIFYLFNNRLISKIL